MKDDITTEQAIQVLRAISTKVIEREIKLRKREIQEIVLETLSLAELQKELDERN